MRGTPRTRPSYERAAGTIGAQGWGCSRRRTSVVPTTHEQHVRRKKAHWEAALFGSVMAALLIGLAALSYILDWAVLGQDGWVWFAVCAPEVLLIVGLIFSAQVAEDRSSHRVLLFFLAVGVLGNLVAILVLVGGLLTAEAADLSAAQLLTSGAVVWLTNVIVFGLCFWTLDAGGPARRARAGRLNIDFRFPQDDESSRAQEDWQPGFEDYLYVSTTNGIAFSPTDAMPLTRWAKRLMALESLISVAAVIVITARAVNELPT
jgi:uncharacterized membrane protein